MDFIHLQEDAPRGRLESLFRLEHHGWVRIGRKVSPQWIRTNDTIAPAFTEGLDKANQEGKAINNPGAPIPVHLRKISQEEAIMILFEGELL